MDHAQTATHAVPLAGGPVPVNGREPTPVPEQPGPKRCRPFVKWAGGKARLLPQLLPLLPAGGVSRYVEPFAGGAAPFFARPPGPATLADINGELMHAYRVVRDHVGALVEHLAELAARHSEEHFYQVRAAYNQGGGDGVRRASMFLYLNRTCFNGLYRVNRRGEFNVPVGRYTKPRILDADRLRRSSARLQGVELRTASFEETLRGAAAGDFVYLDPPYDPRSRSASFTAYCPGGFDQDRQRELRAVFGELDRRGCLLMLSNSETPWVRKLYQGFRIDRVMTARSINCKGGRRGPISELVVRNYTGRMP